MAKADVTATRCQKEAVVQFMRLGVALGRSVRGHRSGMHLSQRLCQITAFSRSDESEASIDLHYVCCFFPGTVDQTSDVFRVGRCIVIIRPRIGAKIHLQGLQLLGLALVY
jgi:hypothetical protein